MQEDAAQRELPLSDKAAARERWLRHDVEAPDPETVNLYLLEHVLVVNRTLVDRVTGGEGYLRRSVLNSGNPLL
jgi:hypothetical protein